MFIEKLYKDANFELVRISSKSGYTVASIETALAGIFDEPQTMPENRSTDETIMCPKCGIAMVLRKANKGQNAGKEFYGCPNYPQCKEIINE